MRTFQFIEGFMPLQFLLELVGIILLFTGVAAVLERAGYSINRLFKTVLVFVTFVLYLTYRVYPPMPFTILATYTTVVLLAMLLWASSTDAYWREFTQPILAVLDAETTPTRVVRTVVIVLLPLLAGWATWNAWLVKVAEPVELRTVGPSPPASFTLHGQEMVLQTSQNPYRVNRQGAYDPHYMAQYVLEESTGRSIELGIRADYWDSKNDTYLSAVQEGGRIYFQECVLCHGAGLNGRGMFQFSLKPYATNFTDPGTIAQLQESYAFWRTASGGIHIPPEGFPWASTMPPTMAATRRAGCNRDGLLPLDAAKCQADGLPCCFLHFSSTSRQRGQMLTTACVVLDITSKTQPP